MIYELPPMPKGTTDEQVNELRAYLIRLVNQLNEESTLNTAHSSTSTQRSEIK